MESSYALGSGLKSTRGFVGWSFSSEALSTLHLCPEFPPRFPQCCGGACKGALHSLREVCQRDSAAESSMRLPFAANILGKYHQNWSLGWWSVPAQLFGSSLEPELWGTALCRNRYSALILGSSSPGRSSLWAASHSVLLWWVAGIWTGPELAGKISVEPLSRDLWCLRKYLSWRWENSENMLYFIGICLLVGGTCTRLFFPVMWKN